MLYLRGHDSQLLILTLPTGDIGHAGRGLPDHADAPTPEPTGREDPGRPPAVTAPSRPAPTLVGHIGLVPAVAFSPDGILLGSTSWDETARLWDVATGAPVRTLTGPTGAGYGVAFSPDGTPLATGGQDGTARLWA